MSDLSRIRRSAAEVAELQRENALFRFKPNVKQFEFIRAQRTKILGMVGANKGGKTTVVAVKGMCNAMGFHPFLPLDDPDYRAYKPNGELLRVPNVGQVACQDFPNGVHRIQWPAWKKWLPKDCFKVAKQERGIIRELWIDVSGLSWADRTHPNYPYSVVHFYAYEQGREPFAGFDPDWILNDEPLPRDLWVEQMRGLVASDGGWMGAMTVIEGTQAWIYEIFEDHPDAVPWERDEKDLKEIADLTKGLTRKMIVMEMRDNLKKDDGSGALSEEAVRSYEATLRPEERAVRVYGKKVHLIGTEWGKYWDPDVHILKEHREPDPDLPHIMAVDPHPTLPYAMLWFEVNEDDEIYAWCESFDWRLDTIRNIAQEIKRIERWKSEPTRRGFAAAIEPGYRRWTSGLEPTVRLMDPLARTNERGLGKDVFQQFAEEELFFQPWKRANKDTRIRNVRDFLKPGWGPHAHPRLTVSPACRELIHEIPRYRERMPQDPETMERKGDMMKVRDHLVDAMIAVCNAGYTYGSLMGIRPRLEEEGKLHRRPLGGKDRKRARDMRGLG